MSGTNYVSAINVHICRSVVPGRAGGHVPGRSAAYENQALRLIASYNEGKPLQFSNFHRFAATAACNPSDIKCTNAFREKAKLYFERNTEIGLITFRDVSIIP